MTERLPPVGPDDDTIARRQFDHYIAQVDPADVPDWAMLRHRLAEALEAAGSGVAIFVGRPLDAQLRRITARRQELAALVDQVHRHHRDVAGDAFRTALYEAWKDLDTDDYATTS